MKENLVEYIPYAYGTVKQLNINNLTSQWHGCCVRRLVNSFGYIFLLLQNNILNIQYKKIKTLNCLIFPIDLEIAKNLSTVQPVIIFLRS